MKALLKDSTNQSGTKSKNELNSHINDPFFVKKAKESKEYFDKHGFPKELLKERQQ